MKKFVEGDSRTKAFLFPEWLDDWMGEDNWVRAIDAFVEELDFRALGFEREAQRNVETMWLTERLAPDFKTIADFRRDAGAAIRQVCWQFVPLCRQIGLFTRALDAIGTTGLTVLADRGYYKGEEVLKCEQAGIEVVLANPPTSNSKAEGRFDKRDFTYDTARDEYICPAGARAAWRFATVQNGMAIHKCWPLACPDCAMRSACMTNKYRRIGR